ncbi:MAG: hypothetical protein ACW99G_01425 [Candidatus Thorarchaeota archaeon]
MLNIMLCITITIVIALLLVNGSLFFKKTVKVLDLHDVFDIERENSFKNEIRDANSLIQELEESVKTSMILNHNYDKEIDLASKKTKQFMDKLDIYIKRGNDEQAKDCIRNIDRLKIETHELQEGLRRQYSQHRLLEEDLDLAKSNLHKLVRKQLSDRIGTEEKLENRTIEETLMRAADEAEVEQKLQEYKKRYDDHTN